MSEQPDELKKYKQIAQDMQLSRDMRYGAVDQIAKVATYEALRALLEIAANESLTNSDRDRALKQAREVIKKTSHS